MLARTPYTLILLRTVQAQADETARREVARERDAKSRKVRLLNRDRRRHLIETAAAILRTARPTHFAFEGSCRHGIRRSLCLEGWPWQDADLAAADVVSTSSECTASIAADPWQSERTVARGNTARRSA
jgi:hypothetical protein